MLYELHSRLCLLFCRTRSLYAQSMLNTARRHRYTLVYTTCHFRDVNMYVRHYIHLDLRHKTWTCSLTKYRLVCGVTSRNPSSATCISSWDTSYVTFCGTAHTSLQSGHEVPVDLLVTYYARKLWRSMQILYVRSDCVSVAPGLKAISYSLQQ